MANSCAIWLSAVLPCIMVAQRRAAAAVTLAIAVREGTSARPGARTAREAPSKGLGRPEKSPAPEEGLVARGADDDDDDADEGAGVAPPRFATPSATEFAKDATAAEAVSGSGGKQPYMLLLACAAALVSSLGTARMRTSSPRE